MRSVIIIVVIVIVCVLVNSMRPLIVKFYTYSTGLFIIMTCAKNNYVYGVFLRLFLDYNVICVINGTTTIALNLTSWKLDCSVIRTKPGPAVYVKENPYHR